MTVSKMIKKISDNKMTLAFILDSLNEIGSQRGLRYELGISYEGKYILIRYDDINHEGIIYYSSYYYTDFVNFISGIYRNTDSQNK